LTEWTGRRVLATADLTAGLVQVQEYGESIAFCGASEQEHLWALFRLRDMLDSMWGQESVKRYYTACYQVIDKFADGIPYFIIARYFLATPQTMTMGQLTSVCWATHEIMHCFMSLAKNLNRIGKLTASARRVQDLHDALDTQERHLTQARNQNKLLADATPVATSLAGELTPTNGLGLDIRDVCLQNPFSAERLVQHLTMSVDPGSSVLIVGPSGVGKSSLLRAISGLWEVQSGTISLPRREELMFLPQNVYIPDIILKDNTLRNQILFPNSSSSQVTNSEIREVLASVNLDHLMDPRGVLTTDDWRKRLSGGEKQRLTMARLLLAKPAVAFLDEATSALDVANEWRLYTALQARGTTYVSVGHKDALRRYHSHVLELRPGGEWTFYESEAFGHAEDD